MATLAVSNTFAAGTTIVAADMNENFDDIEAFVNTTPGVVQNDIVDVLGDLLVGTAADAVGRLAAGTNNHVLTADSTVAAHGLKWAAAPTPVDITVADTTDTTCFVGVFESATGDLAPKTDGALLYNAGTGSLEATVFTGPLTGAVTGNADTATTAGTVTTAAQGAITSVGTLTGLTTSGAVNFGSDGAGVDVSFHSLTGSDLMLWDASDEKLVITGTNGANALEVADGDVSITDNATITGNLTVTGQTINHLVIENNSDAAIAPALGDENTYFVTTHATAVVTLPQDSAQAFVIGTVMYFERNGTGTLTFAAGTGATVTSKDSTLTCADRYTTVAAVKVSADGWSLIGNIG